MTKYESHPAEYEGQPAEYGAYLTKYEAHPAKKRAHEKLPVNRPFSIQALAADPAGNHAGKVCRESL